MKSRSNPWALVGLLALLQGCSGVRAEVGAPERAGRPDLGPNVLVFDPSMEDIQSRIDAVFAKQESGQFNSNRYALLFKPGAYKLDVQVGFYTQVAGLGRSPDDVKITGAVRSKARWMKRNNATCNFWRCAENLSVTPTVEGNTNVWAVSQGTALRRVHVQGNLVLSDGGWSSGGFIADCKIDGEVDAGSQQQWFARNAEWSGWRSGQWNMVFMGVDHPPAGAWPDKPHTVIERTPLVREKPYLFVDEAGDYFVQSPRFEPEGSRGITWKTQPIGGTAIPLERFLIARPDKDTTASINAALDAGRNVLFTPGIYHLDGPIRVTRSDTVVLGLGYPTLVADKGNMLMQLADVDGLQVGGLLLEAGEMESPTLLEVGTAGSSAAHTGNPTFLYDIYCRAGGAALGVANTLVTIHSSNVVGENFWLWRADHGKGAEWASNKNAHGLIVNGADVTIYGLFVEHCQKYQTIWNGNGGRVYFYQSEMPYDPPSQEAWMHAGVRGYASYKVGDKVTTHEAWGLGVYCVFWDAAVVAETAIEAPDVPGVKLHHMITVRLNGKPGSGINHVLNGTGAAVITTKTAMLD
jgi:hypothetical protein